jgi:protein SCO1/2
VVVLFFTHCEYACPVLVRDLKRIEAALPEAMRSSVDFLLISLDSERDTPAVLAEYRASHRLGLDHWTLLTGTGDDVRELAALLGVNYRKDVRGQYSHSNLITVLNARGEVIHQQTGLDQDPAATVAALVKEAGSKGAK